VALDSTLADAHTSLGLIHLFYDRDWDGARTELEAARRLDPKNGEARLFYGWYLIAMNRDSSAVDSLRSAVRDEPVSLILNLRLGSLLMFSGRYVEAKAQLTHLFELSSDFPIANLDLARIAIVESDYLAASRYMARAPEWVSSYGSGIHGVVLAKTGRKAEALAEAERLQHGTGPNVSALGAAHVFTALGDVDKAFEWLERAYERRESMLFVVRTDPLLAPLRRDARWAPFVAKMKFP
jgi:tetratricopeptide (TPR) repeat protein